MKDYKLENIGAIAVSIREHRVTKVKTLIFNLLVTVNGEPANVELPLSKVDASALCQALEKGYKETYNEPMIATKNVEGTDGKVQTVSDLEDGEVCPDCGETRTHSALPDNIASIFKNRETKSETSNDDKLEDLERQLSFMEVMTAKFELISPDAEELPNLRKLRDMAKETLALYKMINGKGLSHSDAAIAVNSLMDKLRNSK